MGRLDVSLVSILVLLYGDWHQVGTWMGLPLYVLSLHSVFILYGVLALSHAQTGRLFRYPVIGGPAFERDVQLRPLLSTSSSPDMPSTTH